MLQAQDGSIVRAGPIFFITYFYQVPYLRSFILYTTTARVMRVHLGTDQASQPWDNVSLVGRSRSGTALDPWYSSPSEAYSFYPTNLRKVLGSYSPLGYCQSCAWKAMGKL